MKKLVALAVAGAFVAPVYADISVSGSIETSYRDIETSTSSTKRFEEDSSFVVSASTETANGLKVSGSIGIEGDGTRNDGAGLKISGGFGALALGDTSGAVDSLDAADFTYQLDGPGLGGRNDVAMAYTLPTFAEGLSVLLTYGAENGEGDELDGGTASAAEGIAIKYSFGAGSIGFATEEVGTDSFDMVALKYSMAGATFAYENNQRTAAGGVKTDFTQWSLTYGLGDTTLGYGNNSQKPSGAAKTADITMVGIYHSLGGGVTVFAEMAENDKGTQTQSSAVGVKFAF